MGKPQGRKKHRQHAASVYGIKGRRFTADQMMDKIYDDMHEGRKEVLPVDLDLPGQGQIYCVSCARYFKDEEVLGQHQRTKVHKRQLKRLQEEPHRGEDLPRDC